MEKSKIKKNDWNKKKTPIIKTKKIKLLFIIWNFNGRKLKKIKNNVYITIWIVVLIFLLFLGNNLNPEKL